MHDARVSSETLRAESAESTACTIRIAQQDRAPLPYPGNAGESSVVSLKRFLPNLYDLIVVLLAARTVHPAYGMT